ncbi:MAG: hypothetical protein ACK4GL_02945 [Flavobacteriales bacterium]
MKIKGLLLGMLALATATSVITSCKKDDDNDNNNNNNNNNNSEKQIVEVSGSITGDVRWTEDKIYLIKGFVRVGTDPSLTGQPTATGTLRIDPGTLIIGDRETKGTLIIQRGSKIFAEGTKQKPIIMTSERPVGLKEPGDWGGLVICGFARNNNPGGVGELEGGYAAYHGGTNDDDNSGILRYVRIEYAGIPINPNQEVNSLTMGSVGRGTVIEYVATSYGLDDSFEWFGGTVNCKYLVAYRSLDDDFDVDNGFRGNVQFGLSIRDRSLADQSGSNGFEVDNDGAGDPLLTPYTAATFSNITVIGPKANRETPISLQFQHAMHLRRFAKIKIHNSFFTGYPFGLYIDGANTTQNAVSGELVLKNNILAGVEHWGGNGYGSAGTIFTGAPSNGAQHPNNPRGAAFRSNVDSLGGAVFEVAALEAWFRTASFNNQVLDKWQDAGIDASIFDLSNDPKVTPNAGSILLQGADFSGLNGFQTVPFRGAFGTEDWTDGWMNWTPSATKYY